MDIRIKASYNFKQVLEKYNGEIMIKKIEEIPYDNTYNANFNGSALSHNFVFNISINLAISVFAPFITDAIKDYINTNHETVVVTTTEEQYIITPSNVDKLTPILNSDLLTAFIEDKNGKNR